MTMEEMGKVSSRNLSASQQTTRAINQLTKTTKGLAASVGTFKLEAEKQTQRQEEMDPTKMKPLARHAKATPQGNTEVAA